MNLITSVESLFGVLYAGFCSAILFGKVRNIYSRATVDFSDVCVIQYGGGIEKEEEDTDTDFDEDDDNAGENEYRAEIETKGESRESLKDPQEASDRRISHRHIPHPELLFRIVNKKANSIGREITNLDINVGVVIESQHENTGDNDITRTAPPRKFHGVNIEPSCVPLFDRIVYVRHVLKQDSFMLNKETRNMMKRNNGKWPLHIDTAARIRSCLDFAYIIVSLEGISDVSRSTVHAQKIYNREEVKIGWRFVEMTYKANGNSKLEYLVDFDLMNVVEEQIGRGGEPLGNHIDFDRISVELEQTRQGGEMRLSGHANLNDQHENDEVEKSL